MRGRMTRSGTAAVFTGSMTLPRVNWRPVICTALIALCGREVAGQESRLAAFEANVVGRDSVASWDGRSRSCLTDFWGEVLGDLFAAVVIDGGATSWHRAAGTGILAELDIADRRPGEALIPFVRLDTVWHRVNSRLDAVDWRAEAGYGPVGAHVNATHYRERHPSARLDLVRALALYRMSFGVHAQADFGLGIVSVRGDESTSRLLFSTPLLLHPGRHWGVEFRPAWADRLDDYDLAVLLTVGPVSAKAGWRWLRAPNESLHGPYAGVSLRF